MYFDKDGFAELLILAKGKRSINKYAIDSKVDAGYISRLSRSLVEKAPSPEVIKKLASKAHNYIQYEQLMQKAGYIENNSKQEKMENLDSYIKETVEKYGDEKEIERAKLVREIINNILDLPEEDQKRISDFAERLKK